METTLKAITIINVGKNIFKSSVFIKNLASS